MQLQRADLPAAANRRVVLFADADPLRVDGGFSHAAAVRADPGGLLYLCSVWNAKRP